MDHIEHEAHPTVCAVQVNLVFRTPMSASELQSSFDTFLSELMCSLRSDGCKLIGHIKGLVETDENGHLFFSMTALDGKIQYKGILLGESPRAKLTMNVIVYGVDESSVEREVQEGLGRHFGEGVMKAGR